MNLHGDELSLMDVEDIWGAVYQLETGGPSSRMPAEGLRILMEALHLNNIRSVSWQHFEVDLPPGFNEVFPATLHDKAFWATSSRRLRAAS